MLATSGFWQTTWPIISAPLFLILGYLGTFLTNSKIEERRFERDEQRRIVEGQRRVLLELLTAIHQMFEAYNVEFAKPLANTDDENRQLRLEALLALVGPRQSIEALTVQVADEAIRADAAAFTEGFTALWPVNLHAPHKDVAAASGVKEIGKRAVTRVGELLRTTYA